MPNQEWQDVSTLCCCEYFNDHQERSHLLGCCCNCEDLDENFDRLIVCERVPLQRVAGIMSTLQDRFRIPWRGGAKQIALDSVLPIVMQPLLAFIAAQNVWCTILVFITLQGSIFHLYNIFLRFLPRTKFFLVWTVSSIVLLLAVFENNVVPLMEILPEENYIFIGLVAASLVCLYRVRSGAGAGHVVNVDPSEDLYGSNGKAAELVCSVCRKRIPPRTYHCRICQACVIGKDHHCIWLDCCIGKRNHLLFVLSLLLSTAALVYGSILTLTSVCHPFFFLDLVLLPDDCSDVYHELEIALCFVSALYCLLLAGLLFLLLLHQCWLISLGLTGQEWRGLTGGARRCCGLRSERPHSRGLLRNWLAFLCCHKQ